MPQLPSLSNLFLGMPTAGNSKKERGKEKQKAKEEKRKEKAAKEKYDMVLTHVPAFLQIRRDILAHYKVNALANIQIIKHYLRELVKYYYMQLFLKGTMELPADVLWMWHNHFCNIMRNGELDPAAHNPLSDALEIDKVLKDEFNSAAIDMYDDYILRNGSSARSPREVMRLLNDEQYVVMLVNAIQNAFLDLYPEKDTPFFMRTYYYWIRLQEMVKEGQIESLRQGREAEQAWLAAQPRPARAPKPAQAPAAPKSRAEFEANKEKHDARVKKEAEEELARKAAHDAEVAQGRAEANARAKREEEEREDALRRQEERNKGGSSSDPWPQEPLSPGAAAKQLVEAQQALDAKKQDIEAQRERIRLAVEAKKKEMAEQQQREDERERARQVANVYKSGAAAPKKDKD